MQLYFFGMNDAAGEDQRKGNVKPSSGSDGGSSAHSSSGPSYFFINPTPSVTIRPLAVTHSFSEKRLTCQEMTGIKHDVVAIFAEGEPFSS